MIDIPDTCRAAVYDPDGGRKLKIQEFPMRAPKPDEILVRVTLCAICGSDLHTIEGRRRPRGPIILGHEICGTISQLGERVSNDNTDQPLRVGDRVTWSIAASCGRCFYCTQNLSQKCETLFKYGHESIDREPPLNGGFADYIFLIPGTAVFQLPDVLPDKLVVFANCSLATMAAAIRLAKVQTGDAVLIQGAGLVGLCAAALSSSRGARAVMVTEISDERLKWAKHFGATYTFNSADRDKKSFRQAVEQAAGQRGFDVVIEACGQPSVIADGLESLRIGGRYVLAGCVFQGADTNLDLGHITTYMLHLIGLHNYTPIDLQAALTFLANYGHRFPFDKIIAKTFPLDKINQALDTSAKRRDWLRVAIDPTLDTLS
jgi:putative phosphonate catabolism associated alcohol dehydrogenase